MALISLIEFEAASPEVRRIYESGAKITGKVLTNWKLLAHNPTVLRAFMPFIGAVLAKGALDQRTKELAMMKGSAVNGCRY